MSRDRSCGKPYKIGAKEPALRLDLFPGESNRLKIKILRMIVISRESRFHECA